MGGGGGDTVTNTGLGDDQYQALADNQVGISDQITSADDAATKRYDQFDTNLASIGADAAGANTNAAGAITATNTGFANLNNTLTAQQDAANAGRKTYYDNLKASLENNTGGLQTSLDAGFAAGQNRFDTLDTSVGGVQTAVDTVGTGVNDLSTDVGTVQTSLDEGFNQAGTRFDALDTGQSTAATTAANNAEAIGTQLTNTQANVLGGQGAIQSNLDVMSDTADAYASQSLTNQDALQTGQDNFVSSFDTYVDRYSQDAEIAQQSRSDLATAQANQTDRLREDLGSFAQAAATGQGAIANQIGSLGEGTAAGFDALGSAVGTGFSESSMADQQAAANLTTRLGNVSKLIDSSSANLDANTQAQYRKLFSSFDENGTLIANSIDENGNTIQRRFDDQGNIIETSFDAAGNQVGSVAMNVNTMLSNAESYQTSLTGQLGRLSSDVGTGFQATSSALGSGFAGASAAGAANQSNLVSQLSSLDNLIQTSSGNIDQNLLSQYTRLSNAFDENGNLITNSIGDQGLTISRAFDAQGRVIETSFDASGNQVDSVAMDVSKMLSDAAAYQNSLTGQIGQLGSDIGTGFTAASGQVNQLGSDLSTGQQGLMAGLDTASSNFDDSIQQQYTALSQTMADQGIDINSVLATGFDANTNTLNSNARDLLMLGSQITGLDASVASDFATVSSAFDSQGNLIGSTVDELGNTVTNQIDQQGNLITSKFDSTGQLIDQSQTNIQNTMSQASQAQMQLQNSLADTTASTLDQLGSSMDQGFASINTAQQNAFSNIDQSFNQQNNTLDAQTKNIAAVAAEQTDIDQKSRNEFRQISNAFDDQGQLITNTVNENGTTISRAIDENGNLLLRSFDLQGNRLGDQVININRSLYNLSQLNTYQGANISMGNLSPAMSEGAPTDGFASPFAVTR